nr:TPM domain-containing protein [uncultured Duganella sp.]
MFAQAFAQNTLAQIPQLTRPVTDLTATLNVEQSARLEARLRAFENRKGSQIAVLIVPTTQPEGIDQYAIRVAEQWRIGRANVDDGAILIVAKDDRTLRIEVGYGLEGALNDATSKRIIDEIIVPRFRRGDFAGGIEAGVDGMIRVIEGEPLPAPRAQPGARSAAGSPLPAMLPALLLAALVLGGIMRAMVGRIPGAMLTGGLLAGVAWLLAGTALIAIIAGAVGFLFTLMSGGRSALPGMYLGGGLGRAGSNGGGLGGGVWGGGGGSFGGGGASGRW